MGLSPVQVIEWSGGSHFGFVGLLPVLVSKGYYSIFRSTIGPKPHWSDAANEDYKVITC